MAGLDMSRGLPRGGPSRKMPTLFQRPHIEIGSRSGEQRRSWQWMPPALLQEGDVVPGMGLVHRVQEIVIAPDYLSGMPSAEIVDAILWAVRVEAGVPESHEYELDASQQIWAFSCEREGTSADG